MKGKNTIQINEATMCEAIQYWLEREMKTAPEVLSVSAVPTGYNACTTFEIEVGSPEDL